MEADQLQDKNVDILTATIAIGVDTSDAVLLYGTTAIGFSIPAAFTGTSVTFLGSMNKGAAGSFVTIRDELNNEISYPVTISSGYPLDANIFAPYDQIQIVSNANEAAERSVPVKPFVI